MNSGETESKVKKGALKFEKVTDLRQQPIRGLWKRGKRYYAQLKTIDPRTGKKRVRRIPLEKDGSTDLTKAQAREALDDLKQLRKNNRLPAPVRSPYFSDYADKYIDRRKKAGEKKPATLQKEAAALGLWKKHFGPEIRLKDIMTFMMNDFVANRQAEGKSPSTINHNIVALRNVLNTAVEDGLLMDVPKRKLLKCVRPERELFTKAEIDLLCKAAVSSKPDGTPVAKNGRQFSDYLLLLACSGMRRREALALKWEDVDFEKRFLTVGRHRATKNKEIRRVKFNSDLESHLRSMWGRKAPDSVWIFPSPKRGDTDRPVIDFRATLDLAKAEAVKECPKLASFKFHDTRHHFVSMAVMSGADFMSVAKWVGHRDGGILIGSTYGHLSDQHQEEQADKVRFGPSSTHREAMA